MEKKKKELDPIQLKKKQELKSFIRKAVRFFWVMFILGLGSVFLLIFGTYNGWFGAMPNVDQLDNPEINVASEIISADGLEIGKFENEKRIPVEYKDLPPHLVDALLAKEDKRFYDHSGIDIEAFGRVVRYLGSKGGGSTISQQLAKLLFTEQRSKNKLERSFQKIKEMIIAVELEKRYTKSEIITMYFNKFDYLHNANGIEMASKIYFNKSANKLTLEEAAVFVGMFENPRIYNPKSHPEKCKEQRNLVLSLMKEQGRISQVQYYESIEKPIVLDFTRVEKTGEGFSSYYKHQLKKEIDKYLVDYEKESGKKYDLYKDGLKVYITIDSRMQKYAEDAIKDHLMTLQRIFFADVRGRRTAPFSGVNMQTATNLFKLAMRRTGRYKTLKAKGLDEEKIVEEFKKPVRLEIFTWKGYEDTLMSPWDSIRYHKHIANCGLMAMEPTTGNIKAWVGGIDWNYFQYDHVKQARRQVGSTFKPFVYASLILNNGYTPCSTISNAPFVKNGWRPKGGGGGGSITLKDALAMSNNTCAVRGMDITGVKNTIALCRDLGIESPINPDLTSALGSSDITLYEMMGAYSTFANYGTYTRPEMIWRIEDANGKVIKEYIPEQREVLNELHAYSMIEVMRAVIAKGTGKPAKGYVNTDIAGKTGTTNLNSDAWFIGMTPKLVCGVWVGWEDRYTHFNSGLGQGAKAALPVWGKFMKNVFANKDLKYDLKDKFIPPNTTDGVFNCESLKNMGGYGQSYGAVDYFEFEENEYTAPTTNTNRTTRSSGSSSGTSNNSSSSINDINQGLNDRDSL